jgi:hypothetical protein
LPNGEESHPGLAETLARLGHRVTLLRDDLPDPAPFDILCISHNAGWYPKLLRKLRRLRQNAAPCPFIVIWHCEPLPMPRAAQLPAPRLHWREIAKIVLRDPRATDPYTNARVLRQATADRLYDLLVVSTPSRQAYLAECGIPSVFVPMGYHLSFGHDLQMPRDIDALFLGALNVPRRRKLVAELRANGVRVQAMGSWHASDTWGESRTRLLNRTRLLLNLQRFPGELSGQRMLLGMANKALVISEPIYLPGPYVPGTHWVSASRDNMPATIAHYLARDDERQRIVEAGHDLATNRLTLERSVGQILTLVQAARTSARSAASANQGTV